MEPAVRRQVTEMGANPAADGRIIYDLAPRPGKRSRAFCAPVRIPREVYLVLLPHGGATDYRTLLHELGTRAALRLHACRPAVRVSMAR